MVNRMAVYYRDQPKECHLAVVVPRNPACSNVNDPDSWFRAEGYLHRKSVAELRERITCEDCLNKLEG